MTQQTSPFLEAKYGWAFGEDNWNGGMDENLLKFSFLFDRNVDNIVGSLPPAVHGEAHYLTSDNRIYFAIGSTYYSAPVPKWFQFQVKSSGDLYQFNGTSSVQIETNTDLDNRLDSVEVTISGLGTAAFEDSSTFTKVIDLADAVIASNGAALVGYRGRDVRRRLDDVVIVSDYGVFTDATTTTSAIMAAWTAATTQGKELWIIGGQGGGTGGRYDVNTMNLAASNLTIRGIGNVELHNVSAGVALNLDRGTSGHYFNFKILGNILVSGNATSTDGVFIRALQHSEIELRVKDVPAVAFRINFGVLTRYKLTCSVNQQTFSIVPTTGIVIDKRNAGEFVSACVFDRPIIEGVSGTGIQLIECQQGVFIGGTSEFNGTGIVTGSQSKTNIFDGIDLEQNTNGDMQLNGVSDEFRNVTCRSTAITNNIEIINAIGNRFIAGDLRCANVQATSTDTYFDGCRFSDNASLGIKGAGKHQRKSCVRYNLSAVITARYSDILGDEGTFTPTIIGTGGGAAHTYSAQVGYYQIVDGRLFFEIFVGVTTKDGTMTGPVSIGGLPFLSKNDTNRFSTAVFSTYSSITTTTARPELTGRISPNVQSIALFINGPAVGTLALDSAAIVNGSSLNLSGSYPLPSQL